jgi:hypothetical protein
MGGDPARHDALVSAALRELVAQVDVIALAQASMARVVGRSCGRPPCADPGQPAAGD